MGKEKRQRIYQEECKKRQKQYEKEQRENQFGRYFRDVQRLINDWFLVGNIDTICNHVRYYENRDAMRKGDKYDPSIRAELYPAIYFTGVQGANAEVDSSKGETFGEGDLQNITLSLVDFSVRLWYEDTSCKVCAFNGAGGKTQLDLGSLIQALPKELFKKFMDCFFGASSALNISPEEGVVFVNEAAKCRFQKKGHFGRWFFLRQMEGYTVRIIFTEEQEDYMLYLFKDRSPAFQQYVQNTATAPRCMKFTF